MEVIGQEEFDRLVKEHEKWLDSVELGSSWVDLEHSLDNAGEGRLVLDGVDLSGLSFDGVDLKGSKITNSKISNSSFVDSDFYLAKFENTIIEDTTFKGSHFTLAEFEGTEVLDSNFSGAWMQMLTVKDGSTFDNCEFKRATLNDTRFVESYILNSDLSETALISTSYHKQNEMFLFLDDLDGTLQRMEKEQLFEGKSKSVEGVIKRVENFEIELVGDPEYVEMNGQHYVKYSLEDEGLDVYFAEREEIIEYKEEFAEIFGYEPKNDSIEFNKYLEVASHPINEMSDIYDFDKVAGYKFSNEYDSDINWSKSADASKERNHSFFNERE